MNIVSYAFSRFVGIDVSKETLDIASADGQSATIGNTRKAIITWINSLLETANTIVVMEATGGDESLLVKILHQRKIALAVVNPRQIRDCGRKPEKTAESDRRTDRNSGSGRRAQCTQGRNPEFREGRWACHCQHHQDLLPASAGKRKTQKSGLDRSHEKALDDPQCARQVESTVESTNSLSRKISVRRAIFERSGSSIDAPSN